MKLNKEWHHAHPMPKNPTQDQKIAWHIEHSKNCSCRKMPAKIAQMIASKTLTSLGVLLRKEIK